MNWRVIFPLSLAGVAMGLLTVYVGLGRFEALVWLGIFVLYGVIVARTLATRRFLHVWLASVLNGVWIGSIHALLSDAYFVHNAAMRDSYASMPHFESVGLTMLVTGPVIGVATGVVAGLVAVLVARLVRSPRATAV